MRSVQRKKDGHFIPVTPQQIANEAGAAVVHVHGRNPETGQPSSALEIMREIIRKVKARSNAVVCISTGGGPGMTIEPGELLAPRHPSLFHENRIAGKKPLTGCPVCG